MMNAIYARAADDESDELIAQIARCREQAQLQGRYVDAGRIYTDAGSWKLDNRRIGLRELRADIDEGEILTVYVDALDRLGRALDVKPMIEGWRKKGVSVVIVSGLIRNTHQSGARNTKQGEV